jgi:GAF domain-containing protein
MYGDLDFGVDRRVVIHHRRDIEIRQAGLLLFDLQQSVGTVDRHRGECFVCPDEQSCERDADDQPAVLDDDADQIAEIQFFLVHVRCSIEGGTLVHHRTHAWIRFR